MKKTIKALTGAGMLTAALFMASCSEGTQDNMENEADTAMAKVENKVDEVRADIDEYRDENFVQDVAEMNSEELHLLALGQQKGTNKEVKAAAKKMEAYHNGMGKELQALATAKSYKLDADNDENKDALANDNAGTDWDKRWADKVVDAHEKAIKKFERGQEKATDPELKAWIDKELPALREHYNAAKELQSKL